jgi:nitrate/nitrite transporter NarK
VNALCDLGAVHLREQLASRAVSPVELLEACLSRIAAVNTAVNAVVTLDEKGARSAARAAEAAIMRGESRGALAGIPVLIKDTQDTWGTITSLIVCQSLLYFFKSFVLASVIALPTKVLRDEQIGTGIGMVNLGGQSAGFVAPMIMGSIVTGTGSFDAAFGFLVAMTAMAVAAAATISTTEARLAPRPV